MKMMRILESHCVMARNKRCVAMRAEQERDGRAKPCTIKRPTKTLIWSRRDKHSPLDCQCQPHSNTHFGRLISRKPHHFHNNCCQLPRASSLQCWCLGRKLTAPVSRSREEEWMCEMDPESSMLFAAAVRCTRPATGDHHWWPAQ